MLSSHPLAIWTYYLFSSKLEKRAKVSRIIYFLLVSSAGHAAPCKSLTKGKAAEWACIISDRKSLCKKEVINVSEDHTSVCIQTWSPLRTILNCYQFIVFSSFSFSALQEIYLFTLQCERPVFLFWLPYKFSNILIVFLICLKEMSSSCHSSPELFSKASFLCCMLWCGNASPTDRLHVPNFASVILVLCSMGR